MVLIFQKVISCGPEKESCVANQTLKDKSCLVPCSGLYADIADDSLKQTTQAFEQNMIKGKIIIDIALRTTYIRFLLADSRA